MVMHRVLAMTCNLQTLEFAAPAVKEASKEKK